MNTRDITARLKVSERHDTILPTTDLDHIFYKLFAKLEEARQIAIELYQTHTKLYGDGGITIQFEEEISNLKMKVDKEFRENAHK